MACRESFFSASDVCERVFRSYGTPVTFMSYFQRLTSLVRIYPAYGSSPFCMQGGVPLGTTSSNEGRKSLDKNSQ